MQKPSERHKLTSDNNILKFKKPVHDPFNSLQTAVCVRVLKKAWLWRRSEGRVGSHAFKAILLLAYSKWPTHQNKCTSFICFNWITNFL